MLRKMLTSAAMAATFAAAIMPAAAVAQDRYWNGRADDRYDHSRFDERDRYQGGDNWRDRRSWDDRGYRSRGWENDGYSRDRGYYDQTGYERSYYARPQYHYRCRRSGTTGTIVGAIAGGLLGNGIAGDGDRTLGTVIGGAAGALAGRAIERSGNGC
ncbi:glycine zipper 2TM domain-containing protein [uncultured Sphingomonas sp.]|uniref:glycine zipper 2TM domain-containing protein n=1 Tax=uncultured Sphingomonas sp. TaxID=158754 RepID=UPI002616AE32|nr:glycine zipper 2TM domain-containing protein [uncultured Sphingomonas sp.]